MMNEVYSTVGNEIAPYAAERVAYYEVNGSGEEVGIALASGGGINDDRAFRGKNAFRNNLKAIKTSLKNAANWIPNIFHRSSHRNGPGEKKSKTKLTRNDSVNSSIHSNSYYSSVLGSENSNSAYTSNSYSTNSSQMYGQYRGSGSGTAATKMASSQMTRCTSYDPISIGGSSRRSSDASCTSLASATVTSMNTRRSTQEPVHLNQTENLVIQPQSLALTTEQFVTPLPPPPPPTQPAPPSAQPVMVNHVPPEPEQLNTTLIKAEVHADPAEEEMSDSMNNLILPDDMVRFLTFSRCLSNLFFFDF